MKKTGFVSTLLIAACSLAGLGFFAGTAGAATTATPQAVSITTYTSTVNVGKSFTFKATVYSDTAKTLPIKTAKVGWSIQSEEDSEAGGATASNTISSGGAFKAAVIGSYTVTATVTGYPSLTASRPVTVMQPFAGGKFTGSALQPDGETQGAILGISATTTTFKALAIDTGGTAYDRSIKSFSGKIASDGTLSATFTNGKGKTTTISGQLVHGDYAISGMAGTWTSTGSGGTESGNWFVNLDTASGAGPKLGTYTISDTSGSGKKTTHQGAVGVVVYTDTNTGVVSYDVMAMGSFNCGTTAIPFGLYGSSQWNGGTNLSFDLYAEAYDDGTCANNEISAHGDGNYSGKKASGKIYDGGSGSQMGTWSTTDL